MRHEQLLELAKAMAQLPPDQRQAVEIAQQTIAGDAPTLGPAGTLPPEVAISIPYFGDNAALSLESKGEKPVPSDAAQFDTTHWSVVLAAGHRSSPDPDDSPKSLSRIIHVRWEKVAQLVGGLSQTPQHGDYKVFSYDTLLSDRRPTDDRVCSSTD